MSRERRKALLAAYREIKPRPGVFAVRCTATGQVWAQSTPNLDTRQNGIWFTLRQGGHPNRALQAEWTAHGEAAFVFEALEAVDAADLSAWELTSRLQARERHWREVLGATAVTG
ncbi:MAG: GIY-YIG nuclease family protein [Caulobacter sp.]|nr:GIY-YIG nuclease family protein [Caulobacter sp.]